MTTYHGRIRTAADAIILLEACRLGLLPQVRRRLSEKDRHSVKSGAVFAWDERESGIRRWTDGKLWSASRVSGPFLIYREMEGKRGDRRFGPREIRRRKSPESGWGSDDGMDKDDKEENEYRKKPDGLMKQSFSIQTSTGKHLHLVSYYSWSHIRCPSFNSLRQTPSSAILCHSAEYIQITVSPRPQH